VNHQIKLELDYHLKEPTIPDSDWFRWKIWHYSLVEG